MLFFLGYGKFIQIKFLHLYFFTIYNFLLQFSSSYYAPLIFQILLTFTEFFNPFFESGFLAVFFDFSSKIFLHFLSSQSQISSKINNQNN